MSFSSKIIIAKNIKMDRDYNNVLSYSEADMLSLVQANQVASASDYSFIRPTKNRISTHFNYNQVLSCNYIAFQNKDYSNKWFFAWIDEVVYKNNGATTEIVFTVDEWSTWFDYWTKKACFVVREHVNDDTIGLHTIPENIDVGDVVAISTYEDEQYKHTYEMGGQVVFSGYWVAMETSYLLNDASSGNPDGSGGSQYSSISVYNSMISGNKYIFFKIDDLSDFKNVALYITRANNDGHVADIKNLFIVPNFLLSHPADLTLHTSYAGTVSDQYKIQWYTTEYSFYPETFDTSFNKPTTFSDYTPKNKKCFCYPYNYILVSNNAGNQNIYKYEDFSGNTVTFENQLSLSIGCSGRVVPRNYKGAVINYDESIPLAKYPTCGWSSDAFTNWLTQNSVNLATSLATMGVSQGVSNYQTSKIQEAKGKTVTGTSGLNIGMSVASEIGNQIGAFYGASLLPNIQGGQPTGDVAFSDDSIGIKFYFMRSKLEYIKIIDDYFSRYGYKVNTTKQPNITGRAYWNYVEIAPTEEIGYGEVPSTSMQVINNACRKGVTIWHTHTYLGNYSLTNSIS